MTVSFGLDFGFNLWLSIIFEQQIYAKYREILCFRNGFHFLKILAVLCVVFH